MGAHLTEISSVASARKAFSREFDLMHDRMLVKKDDGQPGLQLLPDIYMENLTGELQTIVGFTAQKDIETQALLGSLFESQFVLQIEMLTNSRKNIFSIEQLDTIRSTARAMIHNQPYFAESASKLLTATSRYADTFNLQLSDVEYVK